MKKAKVKVKNPLFVAVKTLRSAENKLSRLMEKQAMLEKTKKLAKIEIEKWAKQV